MAKKDILLENISARNIAVNCLSVFGRKHIYIKDTLNRIFGQTTLDSRTRRLAFELAMGTCRRLITLDYLIGKFSNRRLRQIDPVLLQILRVALYQIIYLDKTPDYAVVHEAVNQAKLTRLRGSGGYVNGILRSIQDAVKGIGVFDPQAGERNILWVGADRGLIFGHDILPDARKNPVKYLSVCYSHPAWLVQRWERHFDKRLLLQVLCANNGYPLLNLRVNSLRISRRELQDMFLKAGIQCAGYDNALQLPSAYRPDMLPGFDLGFFTVQDATAMEVAPQLNPQPGWQVLDMCAAPGGKTTHLAEIMSNQGRIIACDVSAEKLALVRENCHRLGITIVQCCLVDELADIIKEGRVFDGVLLDVPCSNTGVLARRVEVRHLLRPNSFTMLARQQEELLSLAERAVKPGGMILYSTCSIERLENEDLIKHFLLRSGRLHLLRQELTLPQGTVASMGMLQDTSKADGPLWRDGGYIALLQRKHL